MSHGFTELIKDGVLCIIALLAFLFLLVRKSGFRVSVIVMLGLGCLLLPPMIAIA